MNNGSYNVESGVFYEPNSFNGPSEDKKYLEPALVLDGAADKYDQQGNDYMGAIDLFKILPSDEKERLYANIAESMEGVCDATIERALAHFEKISPEYAAGVKKALGK